MPRKNIIISDVYPYQLTNRSNNKEFFLIPLEELWLIFIDHLKIAKEKFECCLHAFVLMSNHYHLMASTPHGNISEVMAYLDSRVAKLANKKLDRINHFFGGRYKWSLIRDEIYFWNAIKYNFRNPVKAGLCLNVEDYKFSSLNNPVEKDFWSIEDQLNSENKEQLLMWFNNKFDANHELAIQKALRRREFKLPRDKNNKIVSLNAPRFKKVAGTF